jgi:hypothetical protein
MSHHYTTRLSLYRGTILEQMVDLDLSQASPLRASRMIRVWVARLFAISVHTGEGLTLRVGTPTE